MGGGGAIVLWLRDYLDSDPGTRTSQLNGLGQVFCISVSSFIIEYK